jgi:FkbM family methyltransferase
MSPPVARLLLTVYRLAVDSGVLRRAWAQHLFLRVYGYYKRIFEARDAEQLAPWVPAAGVVIDVGANVGFFALKFARWLGAGGQLLALEPEPANLAHLREALAAARPACEVDVIAAAAADHVGTAHLALNPYHPGDHKLADAGLAVRLTTLDAEVARRALTRVDLIKIDVQGAEALVLAGARQTLARWRPALYVEVDELNLRRYASSAADLLDDVQRHGYRMHRLDGEGLSAPLTTAAACAWLATRGYADLLFLPTTTASP